MSNAGDFYAAVEGGSVESLGFIEINKTTNTVKKVKKTRNDDI